MIKMNAIVSGLAISGSLALTAHAAPISPSGMGAALQSQSIVEQVQYRWAGREYCFYDDGWHGSGWYWCGYRLRTGFGWGGPSGWHSWRVEREPLERGRVGVIEGGRGGYVERNGRSAERGGVTVERRGLAQEHSGARVRGNVGINEGSGAAGRGEAGIRTPGSRSGEVSGRMGGRAPTTTGSGGGFGGAASGGGHAGGGGGNRGER